MNMILRSLILFLALTGAITLLLNFTELQLGQANFWDHHGVFFLVFITLFPRLTLLFSSVPFGGFLWWLGFFFAPRILVATLATLSYWHMNPILVIISWLVAISGETGEKALFRNRVKIVHFNRFRHRAHSTNPHESEPAHQNRSSRVTDAKKSSDKTVIDVDYQRID